MQISPWFVFTKLAGFVNESFRIDTNNTNRVIFEFYFHKPNPRNESFEHCRTNRIHETNHLNNVGWNESMKWIFWKQYGFANPKPRIRTDSGLFKVRLCSKDSWGFGRIHEKGLIFGSSGHKSNPKFKSLRIRLANLWSQICQSRNKVESGFVTTIQNESMF